MSEVTKWKLNPNPTTMHYDEENELMTQVSLGDIYISQYQDEYCQK